MKKFTSLAISSFLLATALVGCSSQTTIDPSLLQDTQVNAQAAKNITLNMVKKNSTEVKDNSSAKIKDKAKEGGVKKATNVIVKFAAPSGKNDWDSQNNAMSARYTLAAMNSASTYSQGYNIGIQALSQMASQGVYVGRVTWSAANATKDWNNGYKVVAAALNHIAADRPNTPYEACVLVQSMMGASTDYADGYRAGYAALQVIGQTDNYTVKNIIDLALRQANSTSDWSYGYSILNNALNQLKVSF